MRHRSTHNRLERLEQLAGFLKSEDRVTVGDLAEELGVTTRTLWRDISILRERGLPIEADRGRGGGIRLHRNWGVGRLSLEYQEAVDLLISLAVAEQMNSPIFMASLKSVRRKLVASFAPSMKRRLDGLTSRVLVGPSASSFVLSTFSAAPKLVVAELHRSFLLLHRLRIDYRDERASLTRRAIEPHYLLLNYPVWYVLAWDALRDDVRSFRCDRIEDAEALDQGFRLRPKSDFQAALDGIGAVPI